MILVAVTAALVSATLSNRLVTADFGLSVVLR